MRVHCSLEPVHSEAQNRTVITDISKAHTQMLTFFLSQQQVFVMQFS